MELICENRLGSVQTQGSIGNLFLHIKGEAYTLRFCEFISTRKRLNSINWESILLNTNTLDDIHSIPLSLKGKGIKLELSDALLLWELLNSAHYIFSLTDLLNRKGVSAEHKEPLLLTSVQEVYEV